MSRTITPLQVRRDLVARREIALFDLREEDNFSKDHPLFASNLPLSRLELEILDRAPRKNVRIVVYDDGEGLVADAISRLAALGYTNVAALEGGLAGWRAAGYELFRDVNSYSKAFGELVEARRHTPSLPAKDLQALIDARENLVILDARRFEEYRTMSIPTGVSAPGAELVLRAQTAAPDPNTTIVVNCAGRTRSIIGAQSLVNAGLPNRVFALRNGTIGWTLADQTLDHGAERRAPEPDEEALRGAIMRARAVSYRAGVKLVDLDGARDLAANDDRTLYRFDVRTPEEYEAGHIPGFRSAPGGQLVQETDVFAPVRGARILLADDLGPRAHMTASWLAQLGWEVYVLDAPFTGARESGPWRPAWPQLPAAKEIDAATLRQRLRTEDVLLLDFAPSPQFKKGHIPGAWFAIRARLDAALKTLPTDRPIVLTSPDGALARLAAADVKRLTSRAPLVLAGGTAAWVASAGALEAGFERAASEPDDVYRRPYEGTDNARGAMQAYLDWEFGLVAQLERDGTHGFFVI